MTRPLACVLLSLLMVTFASSPGAEEKGTVLIDGGHFDCLPVSTFGLKGLRLWQPEVQVTALLGKPESIAISGSEDDGGPYEIRTYDYGDLKVDIVRGRIDRIYTDSGKVAMESGIRVGQNMKQVVETLGRRPRDWQGEGFEFSIVTCPVNGKWVQEDYVDLNFNADKILVSIEYAANRP
jgi:hypothetical protein